MNILTALFGTKEQKAQAKADDAEKAQERADVKAAKDAARAQKISDRRAYKLALKAQRDANRADKRKTNEESAKNFDENFGPAAVIDSLGKAFTPDSTNVAIRQQGKTDRANAKAQARVNAAMARAQANIARAQAGDTTSPGQDIAAAALGTFSEQSDAVMGLAAQYLGGKAMGSGLSAAEQLAAAPGAQAAVDTPIGSASAGASNTGLLLIGAAIVGAVALSSKSRKAS
jgi:hypothetical protein